MKTASFALALATATAMASACSLTSATLRRELQFVPQGNNPGPFRPNVAIPGPTNGLSPAMAPSEAVPGASEAQPSDAAVASNVEADPASSIPAATVSTPPSDTTMPTTVTSGEAPQDQPTIMVIAPDYLATGSGWSSYSGDVGETTTPPIEKPMPDTEAPTSASAPPQLGALAVAAAVISMAAVALV